MNVTSAAAWCALPQPFLAREAFAAGLSSEAISGAIRRRHVIRVARSVYTVPEVWTTLDAADLHRRLTRAAVASIDGAVASHQSAALVHDLPHPLGPMGCPTVTVPASTRSSATPDWRRILHAELPPDHVTAVSGLAVTTPARTVADCLRQLRLRDALAVADGALRAGLLTVAQLEELRAYQSRWPGVRNIDAAVPLLDPRRESWLESASAATAHLLGYPRPESQIWIHRMDGSVVGRVDFLWRAAGVIGEADGQGKYLGEFSGEPWDAARAAGLMLAERDRERALEGLGFAVARWGTSALLQGGRDLDLVLREAGKRSDPRRIRCLWRQDQTDALRVWSDRPQVPGSGGGHRAA